MSSFERLQYSFYFCFFSWALRFANPQYARTAGETLLVLFAVVCDGTIPCFNTCRSFEESGNV